MFDSEQKIILQLSIQQNIPAKKKNEMKKLRESVPHLTQIYVFRLFLLLYAKASISSHETNVYMVEIICLTVLIIIINVSPLCVSDPLRFIIFRYHVWCLPSKPVNCQKAYIIGV